MCDYCFCYENMKNIPTLSVAVSGEGICDLGINIVSKLGRINVLNSRGGINIIAVVKGRISDLCPSIQVVVLRKLGSLLGVFCHAVGTEGCVYIFSSRLLLVHAIIQLRWEVQRRIEYLILVAMKVEGRLTRLL